MPSGEAPTERFVLTALTADPARAQACDGAGVDRVGVDIERLGKRERQGHIADARISSHTIDDLAVIAPLLHHAAAFIRVNPMHDGSAAEIERALAAGARTIMLPYFRHADAVRAFVDRVAGRAAPIVLLETAEAASRVAEIVAVPGLIEVMVGLNDLHRDLGLPSHFAVLCTTLIETVAGQVRDAGLGFGFGGVAHPDDMALPIAPDLIYAQYARLGANAAWLSRSFFRHAGARELAGALVRLRVRLAAWQEASPAELDRQHRALAAAVARLPAPASP